MQNINTQIKSEHPFITWLCAKGKRERVPLDATDKLHFSMRTTAKCRYNAALRLTHQSKFAFYTVTLLSLGLVFIPLMQNASVPLAFHANVLNMMQIFLGVAVLVYTVVIGTARYDMRAAQLRDCGDKLKDLIRELEKEQEAYTGNMPPNQLTEFQKRYSELISDMESHNGNDYQFATLEMVNDYYISGLPRFKLYIEAQLVHASSFLLPALLVLMEIIFVTDMMGATDVFTPYLNGTARESKLSLRSSEIPSHANDANSEIVRGVPGDIK